MIIPNFNLNLTELPQPIFELPSHLLDVVLPDTPAYLEGGGASGGGGSIPAPTSKSFIKHVKVDKMISYSITPPSELNVTKNIILQKSLYYLTNENIQQPIVKDISLYKDISYEVV